VLSTDVLYLYAEFCSHIILCAAILTKYVTNGKGPLNDQWEISCAGYNNDFYKIPGIAGG